MQFLPSQAVLSPDVLLRLVPMPLVLGKLVDVCGLGGGEPRVRRGDFIPPKARANTLHFIKQWHTHRSGSNSQSYPQAEAVEGSCSLQPITPQALSSLGLLLRACGRVTQAEGQHGASPDLP